MGTEVLCEARAEGNNDADVEEIGASSDETETNWCDWEEMDVGTCNIVEDISTCVEGAGGISKCDEMGRCGEVDENGISCAEVEEGCDEMEKSGSLVAAKGSEADIGGSDEVESGSD